MTDIRGTRYVTCVIWIWSRLWIPRSMVTCELLLTFSLRLLKSWHKCGSHRARITSIDQQHKRTAITSPLEQTLKDDIPWWDLQTRLFRFLMDRFRLLSYGLSCPKVGERKSSRGNELQCCAKPEYPENVDSRSSLNEKNSVSITKWVNHQKKGEERKMYNNGPNKFVSPHVQDLWWRFHSHLINHFTGA